MTKQEREEKRRKKLQSLLAFDKEYYIGGKIPAGMDEVGRGPIAGPVVSACVCMKADSEILGIDDSKKVTKAGRIKLFDKIIEDARAIGIGIVPHNIIDRINILNATKLAMRAALYDMLSVKRAVGSSGIILSYESLVNTLSVFESDALFLLNVSSLSHEKFTLSRIIPNTEKTHDDRNRDDGNSAKCSDGVLNKDEITLLVDAVKLDDVGTPVHSIIRGDEKSYSIAASSIVAKVIRDEMMKKADEMYPGYDFKSNKGYGTKRHYEGIKLYGISDIHRKTFVK
ncbi:ribonuclease HII [Eubacterium saphenum ATCC 49989]|nr:ribonuclease HII [Eubacterium saphenum ATCC 49989]